MSFGLRVSIRRFDPVETELRVEATVPIEGRVMGPQCRYSTTVEVAHYLRPLPDEPLAWRVVVPEPSLWSPTSPFLYRAVAQANGVRQTLRLGLRGVRLVDGVFRVNQRPFRVQAAERRTLADAAELRAAGVNTLVVPTGPETRGLWETADEWGFFLLGMVADAAGAALVPELERHASCLGWLRAADVPLSAKAPVGRRADRPAFGDAAFVLGSDPDAPLGAFVA